MNPRKRLTRYCKYYNTCIERLALNKYRDYKWDLWFLSSIIVLSIISVYLNYVPATENLFPPFNTTNSEALGQLGDYVGGILNPILGLCSVILLMWSISTQRKEAKDNLDILKLQIQLQQQEIARAQIAETINFELTSIEILFSEKFNSISVVYPITDNDYPESATITFDSINTLLDQCKEAFGYPNVELHKRLQYYDPYDKTYSDSNFWRFWNKANEIEHKMKFIFTAYLEHLKVCNIKTTNDKWFSKIFQVIQNCERIGIYDSDNPNEETHQIQTARNNKIYQTPI